MAIDRRTMLAGAGVAGLAATGLWSMAQSATAQSATGPRVRRPISGMAANDPDLVALRTAIPQMRRSGLWNAQIALHADMNQRHHSSWRFLPWHRLQLMWFERNVALISGRPGFALPYWDWDDDHVPAVLYSDPALNLPGRIATSGDSIRAFMARNGQTYTGRITDDFATFFGRPRDPGRDPSRGYAGSAEWSGHNMMHGFVGGDMGRLDRSPNDPLFWLHHANIDRVWTLWAARRGSDLYPKAWRDEAFTGFLDTHGRRAPTVTAASTIDTAGFGYVYQVDLTPPLVFATGPRREIRQATLSLEAQVTGLRRAVLDIPAADADNGKASATGYLDLRPDAEVASVVTLKGYSVTGRDLLFEESVFLVPSGACESQKGHRVNLSRLWGRSGTGGIRLEIEASPLAGRSVATSTQILGFVLDAEVTYYAED